jgi:triphosphoribosyl-dephospho-CoA synthetase
MPISDDEIWTAANLLIRRYGARAHREAIQRAGDMLVRGDTDEHVAASPRDPA